MNWTRCKRFLRCESGSTTIEFALVATPFLALLYAILGLGILFFAQEVLQSAVAQSARLIMTGQAQSENMSASQFQRNVCANAAVLFDCSGIYVNVQNFSSFSSIAMLDPLHHGTFNKDAMNYTPGGRGDIVLVQVFYQWPTFAGPLGFNLSNVDGNSRLIVATAVFRNEPY